MTGFLHYHEDKKNDRDKCRGIHLGTYSLSGNGIERKKYYIREKSEYEKSEVNQKSV